MHVRHELKGAIDRFMVPIGRCIIRSLPKNPNPAQIVDSIKRFPSVHPYYLLGAMQCRTEFIELLTRVADLRPKNVLEIGTASGGTLYAWSHYAQTSVTSIDLPCGIHGGGYHPNRAKFYRDFSILGLHPWIQLITGDSHNPELAKLVPQPVDFLYIDADHREAGVRTDYRLYSKLVRPGGLIAFHDVYTHRMFPECGVMPVFIEACKENGGGEIIHHNSNIGVGLVVKK